MTSAELIGAPSLNDVAILADSWQGFGAMATRVRRQGFEPSLSSYPNGWRAPFLHHHGGGPPGMTTSYL